MKKVIKLILIFIVIIFLLMFYNEYFSNDKNADAIKFNNEVSKEFIDKDNNNLIKNLEYKINLDELKKYNLNAEISELSYENDVEIIKMQVVNASFLEKEKSSLLIFSDEAIYNSLNHNTNFIGNVKIEYENNTIIANNMNLDFEKKNII